MFYSQFILAKKGPLGTIWIAAHLERKLRKNQVADTDIGVSVDSILAPDVPIALRLSSHLLVGVVRIYSRKVNYLFDDCSEALLKIKQAFRSTAVDLPPEESTAPYHSITLPETFDLDDFELPDNDILEGNYVDHHISSKEQITLQDTMDGVLNSTSQFGLDERFGDGDTSVLDPEEELFLSKVAAAGHDDLMFNSGDPQSSVQPMASFNHAETTETTDNSAIMITSANKHSEEINDDTNHLEYDQAPRTPGLLEEPNLSNIQDTSACDDHLEFEHQNLTEFAVKENMENASSNSALYLGDRNEVNGALCTGLTPVPGHPTSDKDNSFLANDLESSQKTPQEEFSTVESSLLGKSDSISLIAPASANPVEDMVMNKICAAPAILNGAEDIQNGIISNNKPEISFNAKTSEDCLEVQRVGLGKTNTGTYDLNNTCQQVSEVLLKNNGTSNQTEFSNDVEMSEDLVQSSPPSNTGKLNAEFVATSEHEKSLTQGTIDKSKEMLELGNSVHENVAGTEDSIQIKSSAAPNLLEREDGSLSAKLSTITQGEEFHEDNGSNQATQLVSCSNLNGQGENVNALDSQLETMTGSVCTEFPAPEKLLSVPEMDAHNSLTMGATPGQLFAQTEGGIDTNATVTGKKRSFAESSLTMQSLNSVDSSTMVLRRTTPESVPHDDDLLSSILVGRKSLALKVKETPQQSLPYLKRHKPAPRATASKRKVLMDEQMVLHGDMIRQQLTDTEDIRRLRKKAPCTRPEISMIQKQSLEDEMFSEPIFTGVSLELTSLHNQAYDLSETTISLDDVNIDHALSKDKAGTFFEATKGMDLYEEFDSRVAEIGGGSNSLDGRVNYEAQPAEAPVLVDYEAQPAEAPVLESQQGDGQSMSLDPASDVAEAKNSQDLHPETIEMDVDAVNTDVTAVVYSSSTVDVTRNGTGDQTAGVLQLDAGITNEVEVTPQIEAPVQTTDEQPNVLPVEIDANAADKKEHNVDIDVHDVDVTEDIPSRHTEICDSVQVETEVCTEGVAHTESVYPTTMSVDMVACGTYNLSDEHAVDEARQNEQALLEEDMFLYAAAEYNVNNLETGGVFGMEEVTNSLDPVMVDGDLRNSMHEENTKEFNIGEVDYNDLNYSAAGNDTEFLNYDEDEVAEADEEDVPNTEETRFIDNSGWSSRTRAVAKYLQIMFDKEAERNRNVLPIDNLLVGKSRKEASRMFFETLVLKTKDYIHVEQAAPFNNINILPRSKLTKIDF